MYRSRQLSAPLLWLRHRGLVPDDRFVASYPRSGSTWLRFMLFEALSGPSSFWDVNRAIPDVGQQRKASMRLPGGGRLIKTHELYRNAYTAGVYVVRDPRSVVVSEYRWATARGLYRGPVDRFVGDFVAGDVHRFGSWAANVRSWLDGEAGSEGRLLVVRFEDMKRDPGATLAAACGAVGVAVTSGGVERAVRNTTLRDMREKERTAGREVRLPGREGRRFINEGSSDAWASVLEADQVAAIEAHAGSLLSRLGYAAAPEA
jgi:hypothetical protein